MKVSELMKALALLPPDSELRFYPRSIYQTIHCGDIDGIYCEVDGVVDIELVNVDEPEGKANERLKD